MNNRMLRSLFIVLFLISGSILSNAQADISFKETVYDFGSVQAGSDTLWHSFTCVNTGSEPLFIQDIKTSCDCTLAEWPKTGIQPGKSAVIRGGFKIEGKSGTFEKNLFITSNTSPASTLLTLKGSIISPSGTP